MKRAGPSQEEIRRHNLSALLRYVHLHGPTSRAVLADRLGLNRSTIMALTAELTAAGLVREELPRETGRAGRPSLVVRPESKRVYVLAFDIGVDRLVVARVGLGGVILDRREAVGRQDVFDLDKVVAVLAGFTGQMLRRAPSGTVCVGAGVSFCGVVRRSDGHVRFGPNIGQTELPFGPVLSRELDLPITVSVANDANLGALAEHQRGIGAQCQDLIYLHGEVGIGGGIIVGGRLLGGGGGYGGEVGHMVVNPRGRPCGCGSTGCLETEVGEMALLSSAGRETSDGLVGREAIRAVVDAAEHGDTVAQDALHKVGGWLGVGLANLVNIFNPEMVIFGGLLREIYLSSAAQVRSRLTTNVMGAFRENLRLRTSELGDDATLVGAAELAFGDVLDNPLETLAELAG